MNIAILHAYSASNKGDRLLVEETIELLKEAYGDSLEITLFASRPETFCLDVKVLRTRPTRAGYQVEYLKALWNLRSFDLVVGVGGGYFRFGSLREAAATTLVHGPQLLAAVTSGRKAVYLPQSIGPAPKQIAWLLERLLSKLDRVFVRDNTSLSEFPNAGFERVPDLALLAPRKMPRLAQEVSPIPVFSARALDGEVPETLTMFGRALGCYEGYIQSVGGTNDDAPVMEMLNPSRILAESELLEGDGPRRVVVAVRLHASLMALAAGHYVIHLAYERKGYGAFSDLGLEPYVHDARTFNIESVMTQVEGLLNDQNYREEYDAKVQAAYARFDDDRRWLLDVLRTMDGAS